MTEQEMQNIIDILRIDVANAQKEIDSLRAENFSLTAQVTQLQSNAEAQGERLTTALQQVDALTQEQAKYYNINTTLRELIASGVSIQPDTAGMVRESLTVIESTMITTIQNVFAAEKLKLG